MRVVWAPWVGVEGGGRASLGSVRDFPAFSAWGTAALSATSGASGGVMYRAWQWGDPAGLSQGQPRPGRRLRAPISELLVWSAVAGGPGGPNLLFALLTLCLRPPVSPSPARRDAAGELDRHTEREPQSTRDRQQTPLSGNCLAFSRCLPGACNEKVSL